MTSSRVDDLLQQAHELKINGNDYFRNGKYEDAMRQYHLMYPLIDNIFKMANEEELKQCSQLRLHATFNICSSYFRLENYSKTLEWAEKTLFLDPIHPRARFRRAQAILGLPEPTIEQLQQCEIDLEEASAHVPESWEPEQEKRFLKTAFVKLEWKNTMNNNESAMVIHDEIDQKNPIYYLSDPKYSVGFKHVLDECYVMSTFKMQYFINRIVKQDNPQLQFWWNVDFDAGTFILTTQDGRKLVYQQDEFQMIGTVDPNDHSFLISYYNHASQFPTIHTRAMKHLIETHDQHHIDEFIKKEIQPDNHEELLSAYAIIAAEHLLNKLKWRGSEHVIDDSREWMFLGFAKVRVCLLVPAFTHTENFRNHFQEKFEIWRTIRGLFGGPMPIEIPCNKRRAFIHFWTSAGYELKHDEKQDQQSGKKRHEIVVGKFIANGDSKVEKISSQETIPVKCQFDDWGRVINQSYSISMTDMLKNPNLFGTE